MPPRWWIKSDTPALGYNITEISDKNQKVHIGLMGSYISKGNNPLAVFEIQIRTFRKKSYYHFKKRLKEKIIDFNAIQEDGNDFCLVLKRIDGSNEEEILKQLEVVFNLVNQI